MVYFSRTLCGIFHLRFRLVLLTLYFCSTKSMDSLTLKRHNFFQNQNNRKATHGFAHRRLLFKLQQKVQKFSDICVSRCSPKTDPETNFLSSENRSFVRYIFSLVTFKETFDILSFNNLFIYFLNLFISLIELKNTH